MLVLDLFIVVTKVVLWASDDTEVWRSLFAKSNWDLKSLEFGVVLRVFHFLKDDTFLHLSDVLFLDNSQEVLEGGVDLIWVELVTLSDRLAEEIESSFL